MADGIRNQEIELGCTWESVPGALLFSWKIPALSTGKAAGGDGSCSANLLCSAPAQPLACSALKGAKATGITAR